MCDRQPDRHTDKFAIAHNRPVDILLITGGGSFAQILGLFQGLKTLKIEVPLAVSRKP